MYDLSPGDVLHIGDDVTLTVLAVEGGLVRFGLAAPDGRRPDAGPDRLRDDQKEGGWDHD